WCSSRSDRRPGARPRRAPSARQPPAQAGHVERPVQLASADRVAQHRHPHAIARLQRLVPVDEHALRLRRTRRGQHFQGLVAEVAVVALVEDQVAHRNSMGRRGGYLSRCAAARHGRFVRNQYNGRPTSPVGTMAVSTFDLFKIGIGPSSSHTVGPMRAAARFVGHWLVEPGRVAEVARVRAEVFGSLALTGRGHGTDKALLLGLEGHQPDTVDPDAIPGLLERIRGEGSIRLAPGHAIAFDEKRDLVMNKRQKLPFHTNGMRFTAYADDGAVAATRDYYSVGGGFVVNPDEAAEDRIVPDDTPLPYPFSSGEELLQRCADSGLSIARVMFANELAWRSEREIHDGLRAIWNAMQACVARGIRADGTLPGGLHVVRRAPGLYRELSSKPEAAMRDPLTTLDWVNLYALAVNEENAAGGRVVTAPTNGAAGIIPAVLHYYDRFCPGSSEQGVFDFLLTAAAIGILYKENASISG